MESARFVLPNHIKSISSQTYWKNNVEAFRYYLAFGICAISTHMVIVEWLSCFIYLLITTWRGHGMEKIFIMDFDEIIEALYSGDQSLICDALNTGGYISDFNDYCDTEAIHTGFYCRVQTGTIFEAIYLISKQTICYKKASSSLKYCPLGMSLMYTPHEFAPCKISVVSNEWIQSYDMATRSFKKVSIKGIEVNEQSAESIIFNNGLKVSSFSIWDGPVKKNDYSLYPASILELYKGEKFSPERNFSRTCYYSDGESTYEKYRGTYAQDV